MVNGKVQLVEAWFQFIQAGKLELECEILEAAMERRAGRGASRRRTELAEAQFSRRRCWLHQQRGTWYEGDLRRSKRDRREYDRGDL